MKCDDTIDALKYLKAEVKDVSPLFPFIEIVDDIDTGGNMELLNNWYQTKREQLRKDFEEKRNKLIDDNKVKSAYDKIVENAKKELTKLLEENREMFEVNTFPGIEAKVKTNMTIREELIDGIKELEEMHNKDKQELDKLFTKISGHIQIAETFEEKEEILKRYNVLDKNGKLN